MSLQNVDIASALRRMADNRIDEAMRDGKFDNLAGKRQKRDAVKLRRRIDQINALARKINTLGTNAINVPAVGVDVEKMIREMRDVASECSR